MTPADAAGELECRRCSDQPCQYRTGRFRIPVRICLEENSVQEVNQGAAVEDSRAFAEEVYAAVGEVIAPATEGVPSLR